MTTITDKLAAALLECADYLAEFMEEGREHRVIRAADAALAEHDDGKAAAPVTLSDAETATVLAALRYWQLRQTGEAPDDDFDDIASNGGELTPLDAYAVDALCERVNSRRDRVQGGA